jgi:hypothetical protein
MISVVVLPLSFPCPVDKCKRVADLCGYLTPTPYYQCVQHGTVEHNHSKRDPFMTARERLPDSEVDSGQPATGNAVLNKVGKHCFGSRTSAGLARRAYRSDPSAVHSQNIYKVVSS